MGRFPLLCGMDCYFLDAFGNVALTAPRKPATAFVHMLQTHAETRHLLQTGRQHALAREEPSDDHQSGFHELTYRLHVEDETIGYLLLSACRGGDQDFEHTRNAWTRLARQGSRLSWARWSKNWQALLTLTADQQAAWQQTLALYAQHALHQLQHELNPEPQRFPALVRQSLQRIRTRYTSPLHLKDVAHELQVSAEHLSRLFHQSTGLRFREYLAETRIAAACEALTNNNQPIAQIAHDVGFATLSRFNRCFRDHRDMTPRDWRRRALNRPIS